MLDAFQFAQFVGFPQLAHGLAGRNSSLAELSSLYSSARLIYARQIHSAQIYDVEDDGQSLRLPLQGYDGFISRQKNTMLIIQTADCAPLLFFEPTTGTIAAAHAGRRGTELGIARKMVERLAGKYQLNPADLLAGIGPSICADCYQIDRARDIHYDLLAENKKQLAAAGVQNIELSGLCTACNASARFYSYRRENTDRRNFAFILLKQV
jgi:copper oxidase (laccase) domain-containing protein